MKQQQQSLLRNRLYFSSVADHLHTARLLHRQLEKTLTADPLFRRLQRNLRIQGSELSAQMAQMELGVLCSRCAATAGGGCCSGVMAGETDAVQILINLMAAIEVRCMHDDEKACCYLGERGCIFAFKPMFCLNYNCSRIRQQSTAEQMKTLEEKAGRLLAAQHHLEKFLLDVIAREGYFSQN